MAVAEKHEGLLSAVAGDEHVPAALQARFPQAQTITVRTTSKPCSGNFDSVMGSSSACSASQPRSTQRRCAPAVHAPIARSTKRPILMVQVKTRVVISSNVSGSTVSSSNGFGSTRRGMAFLAAHPAEDCNACAGERLPGPIGLRVSGATRSARSVSAPRNQNRA